MNDVLLVMYNLTFLLGKMLFQHQQCLISIQIKTPLQKDHPQLLAGI